MHTCFLLLSLVLASPSSDSIRIINVGPPAEVHRDFYQYRIGWLRHRWRTDWVQNSVTYQGDTLGNNLLPSDMDELFARITLPDTADVQLDQWIVRYEQLPNGKITRGPIRVSHVDEAALLKRQQQSSKWLERPKNVPILEYHATFGLLSKKNATPTRE